MRCYCKSWRFPLSNYIIIRVIIQLKNSLIPNCRFGVSGFPTIKFFSKDNKEGEAYNGGRSEGDFIKYLNDKCGLKRVSGGGLSEEAGRLDSLDSLAVKFMAAEDKAVVMAETVEASSGLDKWVIWDVRMM